MPPSTSARVLLPPRWLLSARGDLVFLVGSCALSWALLGLWQAGALTVQHLILLWVFVFHGPHFWGTISRTYLDPTEWERRGPVLRRSFLWFLFGPLLVGAGLVVQVASGWDDVVLVFFFFAALWAYHHVVKQHFGFMALYRARHAEFDKREFTFHKWYLVLSLWAPVAVVLLTAQLWASQIPFYARVASSPLGPRAGELVQAAATVAFGLFWALQVAFVVHLAWRVARGRGINVPELLIVLAAVPLHYVLARACIDAAARPGADPIAAYAFVPISTIFHNVQYHALIRRYHAVKYAGEGAERFGWAHRLNRTLWVYLACGLAYTLATIGLEFYGLYDVRLLARDAPLGLLVASAIWGFSFLHYYLDGHIWHVRSDADLRRTLGFPEPERAAASPAAARAVAEPAMAEAAER